MFLDERPWSEFRETVAAYRSVLTDDEDGPGLRPFRVLSPDLNVRSTPDTQFAPLYTLQKGEVVLANAQAVSRGKWVEIEDGKFVNGKFLGNALSL